jgi:hypothetical protein
MSDGPPTEDRAVSSFLDYVALACIFGFVDALIAGKWLISFGALGAALVFHIVGIKWSQIKLKVGTRVAGSVGRIANDYRYRRGMVGVGILLVVVGLLFGAIWIVRLHRLKYETKARKESQPQSASVKIESPAPEHTVVPSSKAPKPRTKLPAKPPVVNEPEEKPVERANPPLLPPSVVIPPASKDQDQTQTGGSPPSIIPQDPVKAVEVMDRMRRSLTAVIDKKETITFLVTWPKDDNSNLVFIEGLISQACRESPRQCWFTQEGNPQDLDKPPVQASGRSGITVHGADAFALAHALGAWFTTHSTSTFPSELNGYNEYHTKEMMWIEIGPGSLWKPTTK